jgi:hypothetical protein
MNKIKYSILTILACSALSGRTQVRHEAAFSVGAGLSSLGYSVNGALFSHDAHMIRNLGGEAAISYTLMFHPNWGIGTGVGIAMYSTTAVLSGCAITATALKFGHDNLHNKDYYYNLTSTMNYYQEKQQVKTLNIPLFVQMQTGRHSGGYLRLGGTLTLPVIGNPTYEVKNASITNVGYIVDLDNSRLDNINDANKYSQSGTIQLNMGFMLMGEAGVKWNMSDVFSMYAGLYFNYGLFIDMHDEKKQAFISADYTTTNGVPKFWTNSIINSKNGANGADIVSGVSPAAVGIVIRLALGSSTQYQYVMPPEVEYLLQALEDPSIAAESHSEETMPTSSPSSTSAAAPQSDNSAGIERQQVRHLSVSAPTNAKAGEHTLVQVYDASGILIHEHLVMGEVTKVEIPNKKGIYLLQIGKQLRKIIVE